MFRCRAALLIKPVYLICDTGAEPAEKNQVFYVLVDPLVGLGDCRLGYIYNVIRPEQQIGSIAFAVNGVLEINANGDRQL